MTYSRKLIVEMLSYLKMVYLFKLIMSVTLQENKTILEYTLDRPGPAAHVFLVSKYSGYLLNKNFKNALRQCPKNYNTTIKMTLSARVTTPDKE